MVAIGYKSCIVIVITVVVIIKTFICQTSNLNRYPRYYTCRYINIAMTLG